VLRGVLAIPFAAILLAQTASQPATVKQLMLDLIHPASNDLLLFVNRGGSNDEKEWAAVRRSALTLAESGKLLAARGPDQGNWAIDAKLLADAGSAAYQAAHAKDLKALAALAEPLDRSCTTCHKHYRPDVFPRQGGSK
jgi:hypothetical protein